MDVVEWTSADQVDRAIKRAAKEAGGDVGSAYRQALRDRFLCRVFANGQSRFVLKGGSGLLARIPEARKTKDLDFAMIDVDSVDTAKGELIALASTDLGDFCTFELTKCEEAMDENGYSRLLHMRFATWLGQEEKDPILIDLSLDCEMTLPPERIAPANRIAVEGLSSCDYLVYAVPDQLADKLCAIMEKQPGGWASSRMKDLVDVVAYARNEAISFRQLSNAVKHECTKRSLAVPDGFAAPDEWKGRFAQFAKRNGVAAPYDSFEGASGLARMIFDPVLAATPEAHYEARWNPEKLAWERA